jgi:hypothetical protein
MFIIFAQNIFRLYALSMLFTLFICENKSGLLKNAQNDLNKPKKRKIFNA